MPKGFVLCLLAQSIAKFKQQHDCNYVRKGVVVDNNRREIGVNRDLEAGHLGGCPTNMEQFNFRGQDGSHIVLFFLWKTADNFILLLQWAAFFLIFFFILYSMCFTLYEDYKT